MRDTPELANLLLRGYVFTITLDGSFMLIPYNQAAGGGYRGKGYGQFDPHSGGSSYGAPTSATFDKRELPPIIKRTPQQRVNSLMSKVGDDLKFYLSGQAGRELSGEETREVAAQALQDADTEYEKAESKRFTRTSGDPYA